MADGPEPSAVLGETDPPLSPDEASGEEPLRARLPLRVVAVDDDPTILRLLSRLFEADRRFTLVATARDGREAVDAVSSHQPDLVVLDVSMPHMGGVAAAAQIHAESPGVRIVMCSGDRHRRVEALRAGAEAWVDKPFHVHDLISALLTAAISGWPTSESGAREGDAARAT